MFHTAHKKIYAYAIISESWCEMRGPLSPSGSCHTSDLASFTASILNSFVNFRLIISDLRSCGHDPIFVSTRSIHRMRLSGGLGGRWPVVRTG